MALRRAPLDDALVICLAMADERSDAFDRAAPVWQARWSAHVAEARIEEAQAVLGALQALAGPGAEPAGRALQAVCARRGLGELVAVLEGWRARRPLEGWLVRRPASACSSRAENGGHRT